MFRPGFPLTVDTTEPGGVAASALLSLCPDLTDTTLPCSGFSLLVRTFEWLAPRPSPGNVIRDLMADPLTHKQFLQILRGVLLLFSLLNILLFSFGHFVS